MTIRRARTQRLGVQAVLVALLGLEVIAMSVSSTDLFVRRSANDVHLIAPHLHFLTGKTLERLRDGAVVPFDFQFTIAAGTKNNVVARAVERFTVSYDVWQEKFSVVRLSDFRKSSLSLSAAAAESWCVDNIFLPTSTVPAGKELWARLEIRSAEQKGQMSPVVDSGISIVTLVELFSRPPHPQQDRWSLETAAFHLPELKPELKP